MRDQLMAPSFYLALGPVTLPNGFTVEPTQSFKEFFGEGAPAHERVISRFLLEDLGYGGHQGNIHWKFEQQRRVFLGRDWPTLRLISAFGFVADHCSPARARQLSFAANVEGDHALLGPSCDPDPRLTDDNGQMIGNVLALISQEIA